MICVLLGPPCSGKTTLGDGLSQTLGLPHILASVELKGLDGSTLHEHGDAVQVGVIMARMRRPDCASGFILDNFPRNAKQAEILEESLQQLFRTGVTHVVDLEVPMKILESRAAARVIDRNTSLPVQLEEVEQSAGQQPDVDELEPQAILSIPSDVQQDAAVHEALLLRRPDDAPERFQRRMQRYADQIASLRHFYKCKGGIVLDGAQSQQEVLAQAARALEATNDASTKDPVVHSPEQLQRYEEVSGYGQASIQSSQPAATHLSGVRSRFQRTECLIQQVSDMLNPFSKDVRGNSKWNTETLRKPCGCKTETKRYIGADPPTSAVKKVLSECGNELAICRNSLWEAREMHLRKQYGDVSPWLSWLLVSCCTASSDIERLQQSYNSLDRRASDARNLLTTLTASTATQTNISYCLAHMPALPSAGSP